MNHRLLFPLGATLCLLVLLATAWGMWRWQTPFPAQGPNQFVPPLVMVDTAPTSLIGTITKLGAGTVTIEGQPPGNSSPITLTVFVDAQTNLIKVGPAPAYATSTGAFTDLQIGATLNIEASEMRNGVRHAERIVIQSSAGQ